jgi:Glycine zipper 2TM domain
MLRTLTLGVAMLAMPVAATAADRDHVNKRELREDRKDIREERRELDRAIRDGDRRDIREERAEYKDAKREYRQDRRDAWRQYGRYDWNRPDPRYRGYSADRYYRDGSYYRPARLSYNDRIYRGDNGRYYCRRSDGTTGLIVGALGGGVLGNVIAPGGSKTLGSIIGGGLGAVIGREIDRGGVTCR